MHIERIHKMIECLTEKALCELDKGVENVNTEEMGEVVDMIKDLNEAEYRAVIVKAMKKADEEEEEYNRELLRALKDEYGEEDGRRYYDEYRYKTTGRYAPKGKGSYVGRRGYEEPPYYHMYPERDMDREYGRMYYTEPTSTHTSESGYDRAKRNYTETKEMHRNGTPEDKEHKMKALDGYMKELSTDITGMIGDMTAEEKNLLRTKLSTLVSKL
jgi:hypothetical protein